MVGKAKKSSLQDRMRKSGVREETRYKDAERPGGGSLPAGITGGIAKLTRLDFDEITKGDNAGNQRLYFHGTIIEPKEFISETGTIRTEGLLVQSKVIPLCESTDWQKNPVSFEENYAKAENYLKLLGVPTEEYEDDDFEESVLDFIKESEIYFRFRTWSSDDAPDRVNTVIEGAIQDYQPSDDSEEAVDVQDEEEEEETPKPSKTKSTKKPAAEKPSKKEEKKEESELTDKQWVALGKKADKGDTECQTQISDWAESNEIDPEGDDYADWSDVVKAVLEKTNESEDDAGEEEEGEGEEFVPIKGHVYSYTPPRAKKPKECEVTAVFEGRKTCNLKASEDGTVFKTISWEALSVIED